MGHGPEDDEPFGAQTLRQRLEWVATMAGDQIIAFAKRYELRSTLNELEASAEGKTLNARTEIAWETFAWGRRYAYLVTLFAGKGLDVYWAERWPIEEKPGYFFVGGLQDGNVSKRGW